MATIVGNDGVIQINSKNVLAVRNFSIELTADTIETSVMGQDTRTYVKGMSQWSGSADVYFDPDTATDGFDAAETTFNPTTFKPGEASVVGKFYVAKDYQGGTTDHLFTGNMIITGYTVNSTMDGLVEASISFQGDGACAFSTGTAL